MPKKSIWMINHYATGMFFNKSGRHHWFAETLLKKGYKPKIFCANTRYNIQNRDSVGIPNGKYTVKYTNNNLYVFVKTISHFDDSING